MFFTIANPMEDENCMEETPCDLNKTKIITSKIDVHPLKNRDGSQRYCGVHAKSCFSNVLPLQWFLSSVMYFSTPFTIRTQQAVLS